MASCENCYKAFEAGYEEAELAYINADRAKIVADAHQMTQDLQRIDRARKGDTMGKPLNYYPGEGNAEVLSFQQVGLYSVEVGRLWACVNCGTAVLARREDLRNCRVCALMAQMQMAMPRG